MGQENSQHLTHTWMEKRVQEPQYITRKGIEGKRGTRKKKRRKKRAKGGRKTIVKRKSSVLLIIPLGHIRKCFLYGCTSNSFPLTLSTNIFSVYSDQLFLPFFTNSLFGLFGPEPTPVLDSSQNWSLHLLQGSNLTQPTWIKLGQV